MDVCIEDMDERELGEMMTRAAKAVERELPPMRGRSGRAKFALLVFDDPAVAQYVSNCERRSMIAALREAADRMERREDVVR